MVSPRENYSGIPGHFWIWSLESTTLMSRKLSRNGVLSLNTSSNFYLHRDKVMRGHTLLPPALALALRAPSTPLLLRARFSNANAALPGCAGISAEGSHCAHAF